ncbi:MAG: Dabb family protein [Planctomycetes bacterium]|nr:Dabb family protein [Planctomycetota bacterium]
MTIRLLLLVGLTLGGVSCGGMRMRVKPAGDPAPALQHVVLVQLDDPKLAEPMMRDAREAFEAIPSLRRWDMGPRVDTGRPGLADWYTVGFITSFETESDYRAYLDHPRHTALVEKWKPHWKRSEILDFGTPAR